MFESGEGDYDIHYYDADNHDAHQLEPLNAGGGNRWRHAAERMAEVDAQFRVRNGEN
jgi:hypothetical protein